jgi:hypothetical protein
VTTPHRVWTEDMRYALSRSGEHVVIERAHVDGNGMRFLTHVLSLPHRDWIDLFAGLCAGAPQMSIANLALLRHQVAVLFEKGRG